MPPKEKLPIAENYDELQARIDLAIAKREAIVKSWVAKYDTSRCAPSKTPEELAAWDAELYNPQPSTLGLGAKVPQAYLNGDANRKGIASNDRLRSLMIGGRKGQQASKPRDAEEKARSMKRLKGESSDEEEGRSSMIRSKKTKRAVTRPAAVDEPKPLPLQQKIPIFTKALGANSSRSGSKAAMSSIEGKPKTQEEIQQPHKPIQVTTVVIEATNTMGVTDVANSDAVPVIDPPANHMDTAAIFEHSTVIEAPLELSAEDLARKKRSKLKKQKQKEKKRREKQLGQAAEGASVDALEEI